MVKGIQAGIRHNDNSEAIIKWFLDQYRIFLEDDFGRSRI
ncbi:hypothetical protein K3N61_02170 [Streptococcus dysgalactiae subsp. dysgalactiae]|nr:hypothetical protein [Streptococcus dysgalactiae subsp. dysgalactiae]